MQNGKYVIYVSPSVQEHNIGIGNYGSEEAEMNDTADILCEFLKIDGRFIVYRNKPEMNLKQIIADSNAKKVDLHIAIHSNACNGKARGTEVFYNLLSVRGKKLAQYIYNNMEAITPSKDRGIKGTLSLGEVKTKAVAALIEVAFHDNLQDAKWIMANKKAIAKAIYQGIIKYLREGK
ncbi:MAG: N-acetylmuramoyl-L-alanine amidase family protein [Deltaproteobacteria bacterium]